MNTKPKPQGPWSKHNGLYWCFLVNEGRDDGDRALLGLTLCGDRLTGSPVWSADPPHWSEVCPNCIRAVREAGRRV